MPMFVPGIFSPQGFLRKHTSLHVLRLHNQASDVLFISVFTGNTDKKLTKAKSSLGAEIQFKILILSVSLIWEQG